MGCNKRAPSRSISVVSCAWCKLQASDSSLQRARRTAIIPAAVPTYDYQCRSCGSVTEVIHSMLEEGPTVCERCGGELRRVLYPAGIIFKGSGFYRTDSRNGSSSSGTTETTTPKPTDAGAGSSTGTDAGASAPPTKDPGAKAKDSPSA